jgi:nucleotide-binding universal stress UspA family protein
MKVKPARQSGKVDLQFSPTAEPRITAAFLNAWQDVSPVKIKKILATTDFSELSMEAVEYAVALGAEFDAGLALIYVYEPSPYLGGLESVVFAPSNAQVIKIEKRRLAKIAKNLSRKDHKIKPVVRCGKAFREIVDEAAEQKIDMIVTGTHGLTGLKRVLLGSTSEWVVRHAPCPVLTVPAETANRLTGKRWTSRIRKILVPVDFSEASVKALPYADALARKFRAEVILMHVTEPLPAADSLSKLAPRSAEATRRVAEEMLSRVQREMFDEIPTEAIIESGTPFHEITRAAARSEADLIILTTHGWTGWKHAKLGSTAERVVRHASCPVLVVRDKGSTP